MRFSMKTGLRHIAGLDACRARIPDKVIEMQIANIPLNSRNTFGTNKQPLFQGKLNREIFFRKKVAIRDRPKLTST